jgi:flagellar protein FliJ
MKKFKFPLQKVLDLRQHLEKSKQQELFALKKKLNAATLTLDTLRDEHVSYQLRRMELEKKGTSSLEILRIEQYSNYLKLKIQEQQVVIKQINDQILKKQKELLEIRKGKKSLEIYKEKKIKQYQKELIMSEQNFLDELATRNYNPIVRPNNNSY